MENKKFSKGITVISLVITIIVLLILAGVTIQTLTGENGILNKANTAKNKTTEEAAKEKVQIAILGSYGEDGKLDIVAMKENLKQIEGISELENTTSLPATVTLDGYQIKIDTNGKVSVEGKKEPPPPVDERWQIVTGDTNKTYTKNGTAIIPVGFAIVPNLDDVSEGLVISDVPNDTENKGNQFVWVPVEDETPYERNRSYANVEVSNSAYDDTGYLPNGITNEETAVRSAKGFYISRYEAGKEKVDGTDTLVSKKGANVWVNISKEKVKTTAKTMFTDNTHVKSALISGVQWDMTMSFISSKSRIDGKGNEYDITKAVNSEESDRHIGTSVTIAGNNEADKVCNIYDLEGNAWEYVAESTRNYSIYPFVGRGGKFNNSNSASSRYSDDDMDFYITSFRLVLYVII